MGYPKVYDVGMTNDKRYSVDRFTWRDALILVAIAVVVGFACAYSGAA